MTLGEIQARLKTLADPRDARTLQWFFKTGPGEYGEGDVFLGIRVPKLRKLVREAWTAEEDVVRGLLESPVHEQRLLALLILVRQFEKGAARDRGRIYRFYLASTRRINNWDLVDLSAPNIAGEFLVERSRRPLYRLVRSRLLWERRIALLATFAFIRRGDFADTLALAECLLGDREDLIHKAAGWMLREVGKRDEAVLEGFLDRHAAAMPRTMLRYAIERFPGAKRQRYMRRTGAAPGAADSGVVDSG